MALTVTETGCLRGEESSHTYRPKDDLAATTLLARIKGCPAHSLLVPGLRSWKNEFSLPCVHIFTNVGCWLPTVLEKTHLKRCEDILQYIKP